MKKVILILVSVLFLVACGEEDIHESVDGSIAKDTRQVMELVDTETPHNELDSDEQDILNSYHETYYPAADYEDPDKSILLLGLDTITTYQENVKLESERDDIERNKELAEQLITTGTVE